MYFSTRTSRAALAALLAFSVSAAAAPVAAQDAAFTWENATELSFVNTAGNASSTTFGIKASLTGTGAPNTLKLEVGGIRASSTITTRRATGTTGSFVITETENTEPTAASYFARGRYDRAFSGAFAFGGAGWDRNTFAGIKNRFAFVAGLGRTWVDGESGRFKTDVGGTYTIQKDVSPAPDADDAFFGFRVTLDATRRLTSTADFASTFIADENLEETGDFRADWINSVAVSISEGLALKTSLQLLYDAEPANLAVPLFDTGGTQIGTVATKGDEIDSIATLTLVIRL
jgi:putative salt-induced outer membrane protein YdiY